MGLEVLGVALVGFLAVLLAGLVVLWLGYRLLKGLLWKTTHHVLDRAVDQVVQAGERQLVSGVGTVSRTVSEEMRKNDPRRQEADVSRLAQAREGRLGLPEVMAELDLPQDSAARTMEGLARRGLCRVEKGEGQGTMYVFAAFLPRLAVLACDYCGGTFQEADPDQPCPNCGAALARKQVTG